jgi:hypothetical protein
VCISSRRIINWLSNLTYFTVTTKSLAKFKDMYPTALVPGPGRPARVIGKTGLPVPLLEIVLALKGVLKFVLMSIRK